MRALFNKEAGERGKVPVNQLSLYQAIKETAESSMCLSRIVNARTIFYSTAALQASSPG